MIRKCILIATTGLMCLLAQGSAWASRYFYVYNNANNGTIVGLWASPHGQRSWESDFITYPIGEGEHSKCFWRYSRPERWFDLKVQFENGRIVQWTQNPFDLQAVTDIYLNYGDGDITANTD